MENMNQRKELVFYPDTIDGHVHMFDCGIEGITDLLEFERQFGYKACNFLSCECMGDAAQNALGIYLKLIAPENYAFGGLHYRYDYSFAEEAKKLIEIGFDGMKMVENKPTLRKQLHMASNDPRYYEFYHLMEQEDMPMVIHVADPEEFWDENAIPSWAKEIGYFYGDGTFVTKETIYSEIIDVLERYPKLQISFAHFFFLSGDRDRLIALMEKYPQIGLDIVSGIEMYFNFSKEPEAWREFFLRYQDRIIFGTDNMNLHDDTEVENARIINTFEHEFIRTNHDIPAWDKTIKGIALPEEVQRKIFRTNFMKLAGAKPKQINLTAAIRYLDARLVDEMLKLTDREIETITYISQYCKKLLV
jgi:predicted TIM-barrel fold metal-dependent hydrolase